MISKLVLKIKRRENAFYDGLYHAAKWLMSCSVPSVRAVHLPLYYLDGLVKRVVSRVVVGLWSVPLFRARCVNAGRNLSLPNGIPYVVGNHLKISLGDNVTINRTTIGASKIFDHPVLRIGNNSSIGYGTVISVAKEVVIGDNCMIAPNCLIMDSDDHPVEPEARLAREPVAKEDVKPVRIGNNVWIGAFSAILKGVTIGDNAVIATHTVVSKDVLANCVYAGYPARPVMRDIDKLLARATSQNSPLKRSQAIRPDEDLG